MLNMAYSLGNKLVILEMSWTYLALAKTLGILAVFYFIYLYSIFNFFFFSKYNYLFFFTYFQQICF